MKTSPWFRGFSLVEMLVAVAIIGTLATILFPVASNAIAQGRATKCAANLRQLGSACLSFAGENNGSLPPGSTWDRAISAYLGVADWNKPGANAPVLTCPADKRTGPLATGKFPRSYSASVIKTGDLTQGVFGDEVNTVSRKLAAIPTPGSTILLFESFTNASGAPLANEQFMSAFAWGSGFQSEAATPRLKDGSFYHRKTMNFAFADGHVETLPPARAYTPPTVLWRVVPKS